ncbi:hypothetical protein BDC45DRAFT_589791 [Circinella umbellata]|nr:hypothetical protein BDC45DRAFT_589791 [Circinella umbellata]
MSMNNTINLLDVDNDQLIEVFQKALVILFKDYGERTADEDEWVEKEPNLFRMFEGGSEGSVEQLNTIKSEVNRLKSLTQFTTVSTGRNNPRLISDLSDSMDPDSTMSIELAALESRLVEELRVGPARIAEKYDRQVESLEPIKLPSLRKNTGLRTGYGAYLSEQFSDQDWENLKRDSKQMGNIIARKATAWNALTVEEKEVFKSKAKAFNEKEGKIRPFSLETKAKRFNLLSNCLSDTLNMLRQECGVESICFVAPSNTQTSLNPPQSGFGTDCGHRFFKMMKKGEVEFTPISFQCEFRFRMLQFNVEDCLASASTTMSTPSNEIQTAKTRLRATKQHAYNTWLKDTILDKYKKAVKDIYNHDIVGEKMQWQDEKMYKEIVLQGWPGGVKRARPCNLNSAQKRKLEESLGNIRFVM